MNDWVRGDALFVLRQMARVSHTEEVPSVASGIFMAGDEVLLQALGERPEEVGVLIESPLTYGPCLRIRVGTLDQWWYWNRVIGWRRP